MTTTKDKHIKINKSEWFYYPMTPIHLGVYEITSCVGKSADKFSFWDGKKFKMARYPVGYSIAAELDAASLAYEMRYADTCLNVERWRGIVLTKKYSYYEFANIYETISEIKKAEQNLKTFRKSLRNL